MNSHRNILNKQINCSSIELNKLLILFKIFISYKITSMEEDIVCKSKRGMQRQYKKNYQPNS